MSTETKADGSPSKLDELMMAMDVVDTLRRDKMALDRELAQDDRDETLKARLREIYEGQGLAVTDAILAEGIAALRESRFAYEPPAPSWEVSLAKLWVGRWRWGPWAAGISGLVIGWVLWSAVTPSDEEALAAQISERAAVATSLATSEPAQARIDALRLAAETALAAGETETAETALAELATVQERLALDYEIRIVSRAGTPTGVERIPDINQGARNRYLIVEAIGAGGAPLTLTVVSEESGKSAQVAIWGQRVPKATFDRVAADKADDGIVQQSRLGTKPAGRLTPDWTMPVEAGAITEWD